MADEFNLLRNITENPQTDSVLEPESVPKSSVPPLDLIIPNSTYTTFASQPIIINCQITGGIPPYSTVNWLKNSDDDTITISPSTDGASFVSDTVSTYIIFATVSDSVSAESNKQFIIEVKDIPITLNIDPPHVTLDIGETAKLTLKFNRLKSLASVVGLEPKGSADDSGWIFENTDGIVFETRTQTKATIKAVKVGNHDISAWVSTSDGTIFDHATIMVTDKHPIINYIIGTVEYVREANDWIYDWIVKRLVGMKHTPGGEM